MTELTDAMIYEAIHEKNTELFAGLIFAVVLAAVFLAVTAVWKPKQNKKEYTFRFPWSRAENEEESETDYRSRAVFRVITIAVCVIAGFNIGYIAYENYCDRRNEKDWRLTTGTVSDLYEKQDETASNRRSFYAYVEGCNRIVELTEGEYTSLEKGDAVYVVLDYEGEGIGLWRMERYTYVGERLMDQLK